MQEQFKNRAYTCPMHPEVVRETPGICPECGMNLVPTEEKKHKEHGKEDYDKHAGHHTEAFKRKFWVSLALSLPVVLYSDIVRTAFAWNPPPFPGSRYLPLIFSSVIFFYGGGVFLTSASRELRARLPGMMTLIALAISTAYLWSLYAVAAGGETLFWELSTLITIMLLGHWMEMRAVSGAQSALKELSKLLPDTAEVMRGGRTEIIPLSEIREGDIALVKPGGKIPSDGVVIEGNSEVNESLATGESRPVPKRAGSEVIAGTVNGDGSLKIRVTKIGEHTFLSGVMRLVAEAQASKSRLQVLSDRAAFYLTVIAVVTGGITLIVWLALKAGTAFAVERLVAVLVIACPHALGLAIPLVASISTTKAAQNGFLVKQRLALEAARNVQTVLFDKTGTLTKGEYGVVDIWTAEGVREEEMMRLAASVNAHSEHVVGRAIVEKAKVLGVSPAPVKDFRRVPGKGVTATVRDNEVFVGGEAMLEHTKTAIPDAMRKKVEDAGKRGQTVIYVVSGRKTLGGFALADIIRGESREAVRDLKAMGIKVAMITGDSEDVAKWVSEELKIDEYFARVLPQEKSSKVKLLQSKGERVAMVGDGINDAPALTQADIGIAIGAGTNVAIESAGIILVRNDPRDIPRIIRLSKMTYAKMIQNLFWATGYNVAAIPLAAGVLASRGVLLEPALAALFMSLSTVIVAVNAMLLKRIRLE